MLDPLRCLGDGRWDWADPRQAYVNLYLEGTTLRGRAGGIPGLGAGIAAWARAQGWQVELQTDPLGYGLVTASLVDLWVDPQVGEVESNRATQARWGTGIRIWERQGDWLLGQLADDGYCGWLKGVGVAAISEQEFQALLQAQRRILPKSSQLGKHWLWAGTAIPLWNRDAELEPLATALPPPPACGPAQVIQTARRFLPTGDEAVSDYLWGGTAGSRMDCSGFVQTVGRLCGRVLPRDADQQAQACQPLDWHALKPGDLMFFGEREITHVGIALGAGAVIHCSRFHNGVRIDPIGDPETEYGAKLRRLFRGGGRWF
ncbi:MAG: NlpC/P60 family protein [Thermostichales cyanobacterium DRC_bins_46]